MICKWEWSFSVAPEQKKSEKSERIRKENKLDGNFLRRAIAVNSRIDITAPTKIPYQQFIQA